MFRRYLVVLVAVCLCIPVLWLGAADTGAERLSAPGSPYFVLEDQIGGAMNAVVAQGDRLYVGMGSRIAVFEVADSAAPRLLARSPVFAGVVRDIAVAGNHLLVAAEEPYRGKDGTVALYVVDASDPAAIRVVGHFGATGVWPQVAAVGSRACFTVRVGSPSGAYYGGVLYDLDLSDAANIETTNRSTLGVPYDVVGGGDTCFIAEGDSTGGAERRTRLLAARPGAAPPYTPVGSLSEGGGGFDLAGLVSVAERLYSFAVYAAEDGAILGILRVMDITDPSHPAVLGEASGLPIDTSWQSEIPMVVVGDKVYLRADVDDRAVLYVFDVADPTNPRLLDPPTTVPGEHAFRSAGLAAGVDRVFWVGSDVQVFDLSDVGIPKAGGQWRGVWQASHVALAGGTAYVADMGGNVSILQPHGASPLSAVVTLSFAGDNPVQEDFRLAVDGARLYAAGLGRVHVADVSDLALPHILGAWEDWTALALAAASGRLYVTGNQTEETDFGTELGLGLDVLDPSDASAPRSLGSLRTRDTHPDLVIVGSTAYLAGNEVALLVADVHDGRAPNELGRWEGGGHAQGVAVSGKWAYVVQNGEGAVVASGLSVVDVSDPAHPTRVGFVPIDDPHGVAVDGSVAYVTAASRLLALEVSDATAPRHIRWTTLPEPVADIAAGAGQVWVPAGPAGLMVLKLADSGATASQLFMPYAALGRPSS